MANETTIKISEELYLNVLQGVIDNFLKPKFIELGMNASGEWLNTIQPIIVEGRGEIWGMDYTYWLNNGREPNKDQSPQALKAWAYYYGINVIQPWAQSKGIVLDNPIGVAYNIAKNGTKKRPERIDFLDILNSDEVKQYIYTQLRIGITATISSLMIKQIRDTFE